MPDNPKITVMSGLLAGPGCEKYCHSHSKLLHGEKIYIGSVYLLSILLGRREVFDALKMQKLSVKIVFFQFLVLSRKMPGQGGKEKFQS